ncbi:dTDP-4-dehydrorhamnose 3,5-epimerase [Desulfosporosinus nitroreducens]|uniref:dTDP-4-dehydrorhamnose 3,5-epimerase n=1 Tax=Desulfosporosinus nitroreducens TaxID=2018668 RepID=A0ABT8QUK9_9FIRM|nr:dTDP-4-dehydrorhamnose 3,5-epimerase [Desulfosporosinus nitroreducens]MDO0824295.1 dTDP-4-dehydrorhamnose 3,5-epimerase [Desulfosporosinus nitroreducens]
MYRVEKTEIPGVLILTPMVFEDQRGFFYEAYSEKALQEAGIDFMAKQENRIMNEYVGVIRGLHFQNVPYAQAKIVRCTKGHVDDVAVDLRKDSTTYLKWVMVGLSAQNHKQLYIPKGFAHGVISRESHSEIEYYVDETYCPEADRTVRFDDPLIGIKWDVETPILSAKDQNAPLYKESDCNF